MNGTHGATIGAIEETTEFFRAIYGDDAPGYVVQCTKGPTGLHAHPVRANRLDDAARLTHQLATGDVWHGVCLLEQPPPPGSRGRAVDVSAMGAVWSDVDVTGPGHKNATKKLPESLGAVVTFFESAPLRPTMIVDSGGGAHVYQCLDELFIIDSDEKRVEAVRLVENYQRWIRQETGWDIDRTADLARLLRPPGPSNHKGAYRTPRPVRLLLNNGPRCSVVELRAFLDAHLEAEPGPEPRRRAEWKPHDDGWLVRPGDAWAVTTSWLDVLVGWTKVRTTSDGVVHVRHPDASSEVSGTITDRGEGTLYVFSDSTDLPVRSPLNKFGAFAWMHFGGNFKRAAEALYAQGFGEKAPHQGANGDRPTRVERRFRCTDYGNAERLVARFGERVHYCYDLGHWLVWTGSQWQVDRGDVEVTRLAKRAVRAIYEEAAGARDDEERREIAKWAARSEGEARIRAMLHLARTEPSIPVAAGALDADPWLLNVRNGTIDLRAGNLRPHRREDLCTRLAPVDFDPDARSELWERFLADATGDETEFIEFLRRAVGYSITGSTAEEVLLFVHGPTSSGKSTFIEAVNETLGPYAMTADFETFVSKPGETGIRNDIARFDGARLVSSVEVDDGRRLAEGLVKLLTGGDRITARFLYREFFEFTPQFTLWLVANHAPRVRHEDDAVWRRILRVPFGRTVPKEERDPALKATLKNPAISGPAILAWAVRGCADWQRQRLGVPKVVEVATAEYRASQDPLRAFLEDRCVLEEGATAASKELRDAYESWCRANGEEPIGTRNFAEVLRGHGCVQRREKRARGWTGVRLALDGDASGDETRHRVTRG